MIILVTDEDSQITDDEGYAQEDDEENFDDRIPPQFFNFQTLLKVIITMKLIIVNIL